MLELLKQPAVLVARLICEHGLVFGGGGFTVTKATPRNAAHCNRFHNYPLFLSPRPDAAVHGYGAGRILFFGAGTDLEMEAVQIDGILLEDDTRITGCFKVSEALGLRVGQVFRVVQTEGRLVLTPFDHVAPPI